MLLSEETAAALRLIVNATEKARGGKRLPTAVLKLSAFRASAGPAAALVESLGLVAVWDRPNGSYATLTPLAAELLNVELAERWEPADPRAWLSRPARPVRLPVHGREVPLKLPEAVVDPNPGPEFLIDPVSEEPVRLFVSDLRPGGVPVKVDRRLGPARRGPKTNQFDLKAMKRMAGARAGSG